MSSDVCLVTASTTRWLQCPTDGIIPSPGGLSEAPSGDATVVDWRVVAVVLAPAGAEAAAIVAAMRSRRA
ncbi:MAG: hypothetical protein ACI364_05705 [Coriobacteriales bacterium]